MEDNWLKMTAADLGRGIEAGTIDPVDLADAFLEAIENHPLSDRIYARVTADRARSEAIAATKRAKSASRLGPLDGVPVSWKDLFDTAGVPTEAGSALLGGRIPSQDAKVLINATNGGMICLGKTHMSELAFSGLGYNPSTSTPPCINDPNAVAGGSSSGAAASVAFDLAPCAIGSDTGGSVRIPAVWNDLVGLKTTAGRLPMGGVVPLANRFDTVGPITRSVEDAAMILAILENGAQPDLRGSSLKGTKMLVLRTVALEDVRAEPAAGFESAVQRLQAASVEIHFGDIPETADAMALTAILYTAEAYAQWRDVIEADPKLMFDQVRERFQAGAEFSAVDYILAWDQLNGLRNSFYDQTAAYDAVLMPTSPIMPPNIERLGNDQEYYISENLLALRNTRIANLMGAPALTLPTGLPSTGIMMVTRPNSEEFLLRLGVAAQAALA